MAPGISVEQPLWHALRGYRLLTLGYALFVYVWELEEFSRPFIGSGYLAVLTVWTALTVRRISSAERCTRPILATDMAVGLSGILLSPLADGHANVGPTLPSIWVASPVLAFALKGGWRWAAVGSLLVGIANVIEQGGLTRTTLHNVLLVCVASVAVGYVVEVARASERTLARALQIEAATRERERLARDIHDSVLQVLAMVQRRGTAIGGEAAELGRMAGEQETALRSLVSSGVVPRRPRPEAAQRPGGAGSGAAAEPARAGAAAASRMGDVGERGGHRPDGAPEPGRPAAPHRSAGLGDGEPHESREPGEFGGPGEPGQFGAFGSPDSSGGSPDSSGGLRPSDAPGEPDELDESGECDVRALLSPYASGRTSFAEPGAPVPLPAPEARELAAAVSAALDNVRQHASDPGGEQARAWILLEDEPDAVLVTVRDDGPGIPPGRLADAEAEGRMGVALSIRGRLRDLGGSAELVSVPGQGTEVELRVPKHER